MDKHYEEEIELKSSEYLEIIKKVEKAALQAGITLEEGIKFLDYLCTSNYN